MKISIINRHQPPSREVMQLVEAGQQEGYEVEVRDVAHLNDLAGATADLGDVIIWRSATIQTRFPSFELAKTTWLSLMKDKIVINGVLATQPMWPYKMAQQQLVHDMKHCKPIPTFHFELRQDLEKHIAEGILQFPFVLKPNRGAQGKEIQLVTKATELADVPDDIHRFIVQPFLENKGDYRVLVLGGVMVGAMKRVGKSNSFLNNIAQGGQAHSVQDPEILARLRLIANELMNISQLTFFGIDILYCEQDQQWYFLEINTTPEWQAFGETTGINVPRELIRLCYALVDREKQPIAQTLRHYYLDRLDCLAPENAFHFLNRLFLMNQDLEAKRRLEQYRQWYIGETAIEHRERLKKCLKGRADIQFMPERETYLSAYPSVVFYNRLLFKVLLSRTVYGEEVWSYAKEVVPISELTATYDALLQDSSAVAFLSTYAVNFLWLFSDLQGECSHRKLAEYVLHISETAYDLSKVAHVHLLLYLLTHAIIAESRFYAEPITDDVELYTQMIEKVESLIVAHYHALSLDSKCEFLVCARVLDHQTLLRKIIESEAKASWATQGNFLVDRWNLQSRRSMVNLDQREHMNTLFLMTHTAAGA